MSNPSSIDSKSDIDPTGTSQFNLDVQIGDLPYVLAGDLPAEPSSFELVVSLPNDKWEELKPKIDETIASNSWFGSRYRELQQSIHLGEGRVGSVWVSPQQTTDNAAAIHVDRIQTDNFYLPEETPYHKAKGVGSAILDNLCALADARGWRIYLFPLERDGRLMGINLQDWYRRRGFKFGFEVDEASEKQMYSSGEMMRLPQQLDQSQPILQALAQ